MDENQNSAISEVAPQDSQPMAIETNASSIQHQVAHLNDDSDEPQEKNWKAIREKQKEIERKRLEAEMRVKAQEELIEKLLKSQATATPQAPEPDEFAGIAPDDYPTWAQVEKLVEKRADAKAAKKFAEEREKEERSRFVEKLQRKYSDFHDVVNPDSIALFEKKYPELANTIAKLGDPYDMGLQTYNFLKNLNLSDEIQDRRNVREVEKKLEKNEKILPSPQVFNKRPMAQAFNLTQADKTALYEEMMRYAQGV